MAMTNAELTLLKKYMIVDHDDDDDLIKELYDTAVEYLADAGIVKPKDGAMQAKYQLAVWALTLSYYDQRGVELDRQVYGSPYLRRLINQLKHSRLPTESETDTG